MNENKKNPHAVALGKLGGFASGKVWTKAKIAASRKNGKKGGRPRKNPVPRKAPRSSLAEEETGDNGA